MKLFVRKIVHFYSTTKGATNFFIFGSTSFFINGNTCRKEKELRNLLC